MTGEGINGNGPADDGLRSVRGIGPEIARRLHAGGVRDLADLTGRPAREIAMIAGVPLAKVEREDWIGQARTLAGPASSPGLPEPDEAGPERRESFLIRLTLGEDGHVLRTTLTHVNSEKEVHYAGWDTGRLLGFLSRYGLDLETPAAPRATEATSPEGDGEEPAGTAPPSSLPGTAGKPVDPAAASPTAETKEEPAGMASPTSAGDSEAPAEPAPVTPTANVGEEPGETAAPDAEIPVREAAADAAPVAVAEAAAEAWVCGLGAVDPVSGVPRRSLEPGEPFAVRLSCRPPAGAAAGAAPAGCRVSVVVTTVGTSPRWTQIVARGDIVLNDLEVNVLDLPVAGLTAGLYRLEGDLRFHRPHHAVTVDGGPLDIDGT